MVTTIKINRAPVLTLWSAIVAEKLGYTQDEALTLGKAVAGLTAQSKGQRLGIYTPAEAELDAKMGTKTKERQPGETSMVEVVGRRVPVVHTEHGLRAQQQKTWRSIQKVSSVIWSKNLVRGWLRRVPRSKH